MSSLDWYGIGALALIIPMFYFIRKVPAYLTGLIQTADEGNTLSSFGRLVSTTVAVVYALVRIKN